MTKPLRLLIHLLFLMLISACARVNAADEEVILTVVATESNSPFSFALPNGEPTGLYVEFWKLWSVTNNIPIKVVILPFEETIERTKNKNTIHSGLFINEPRQLWADFSLPMHRVKTGVTYNNQFSKETKLGELKNINISTQQGSFQEGYLQLKHPKLDLILYSDDDDAINKLLSGEVQGLVGEIPYLQSLLAQRRLTGVFTLSDEILLSNEVFGVIAKGQNELLKKINQGIDNIPIKKLVALEKRWLPTVKPFFSEAAILEDLTRAEKKWLQKKSTFTLGIDNSYFPFDFRNKEGNYSGISSDYIDFVSQSLNVNFETVDTPNWLNAFEQFKKGNIDIMTAIIATDERRKTIHFTEPYIVTPTVIVTRKNSFYVGKIENLIGKKVGLVKGFAVADLVKTFYPEINIHSVRSTKEGLLKLQRGEVDAYIGEISIVNSALDKEKMTDLIIVTFAPFDLEVSMAVRSGLEPLIPILNKVFSNMDEKAKTAIANNWLAIHVENGTDIKTILAWSTPILILFITIIFIIMRFNKNLKYEIANRKEIEKKLKHLAHHDALTELPNWRLFEELSNLALSQAKRCEQEQAVLFLDMDGFKAVNDSLGHLAGDELLKIIAQRLKKCVRESDIVARIGGDEFCIHLCNQCSIADTKIIASKIIAFISVPFELKLGSVKIGVSIGVSVYPKHSDSVETLISQADSAMYTAKKSGKNTYCFFLDLE